MKNIFQNVELTQYISGLGLGLYISSQIIKKHSGSIDFTSEKDK